MSVAVALLSACGGSQPIGAPPGAIPQSAALATHATRGTSWMLPAAKGGDLLYIADAGSNKGVDVYSYPGGKLVGMLDVEASPFGECVSADGDVFVVEANQIVEYAHGGTKPIETLNIAGSEQTAWSCAVDSTTGSLAVTRWGYSEDGDVLVYPKASGTPIMYANIPGVSNPYYCVYDEQGNLFVVGQKGIYQFGFDELTKGSNTFFHIQLERRMGLLKARGGVQWDGRHVVLAGKTNYIYQYRLHGAEGSRAGHTMLENHTYVSAFWIQGQQVVVPSGESVMIYDYPAGGTATKTITGFGQPTAAVVSLGRSH
ncbi:MAG: hypothetical protein WA814_04530 [Candidatus Baltobacteraceae bacterium]